MQTKVAKQQGTQDFFPRNVQKQKGYIFNKAPLNKREAQKEVLENVAEGKIKKGKRSAFMAKLYDEDADNMFRDEMNVFEMNEEGSDVEVDQKKRTDKEQFKTKKKGPQIQSKTVETSKINRLKFSPGSLGLFAICEVHSKYLIVNYTRNMKGYISLEGMPYTKYEVGQFIVAAVLSQGTSKYNTESSGYRNKKLQLTLDQAQINKSLTSETLIPNMILQGVVESKEAKGYLIDFGLKDKTKGFLPFNDEIMFEKGELVKVVIKSIIGSSKVAKCEQLIEPERTFINAKELTIHNIKPGFLVNAKVTKILENGIELNFLGGFTGTVFIDHLDKENPNKYKNGEKLQARIIVVDPQTQTICLSLKPHIITLNNVAQNFQNSGIAIGKIYDTAVIEKEIYGGSFKVKIDKNVHAFLHKTHTKDLDKEEEDDDKSKPQDLKIGLKLQKVRVKEINYFDAVPIISLREDVVNTSVLNYDNIKCGDFLQGTVSIVDEQNRFIEIQVNDFVKGKLYIEHMADFPLKVIPPKYKDLGKSIKVRVFGIDHKTRSLEFTRKETLLKAKVPVFQTYKEVKKGQKIYGVIVGENEFGYVTKTFGGIKCFLTFEEIKNHKKQNQKDQQFKIGSIVKSYVLFKKKDQGLALTLDKVKAKQLRSENINNGKIGNDGNFSHLEELFPKDKEVEQLRIKYKTMLKYSSDKQNIGKIFTFKIVETNETYFVSKSMDAEKKSHNIIAILPRVLISKHQVPSFGLEDFTFQGLVLDKISDNLPLISAQLDLISLLHQIPTDQSEISLENPNYKIFCGVVNQTNKAGVQVRFMKGLKKQILIKDLEITQNYEKVYSVGKVVRVALNKKNRLCLKEKILFLNDSKQIQEDKKVQIKALEGCLDPLLKVNEVKIGEKVDVVVTLVKDYGLIVQVEKYPQLTGFILTEHQVQGKTYKERQKLKCLVLDVDFEKEIIDLSEKLGESKPSKKQNLAQNQKVKVIIELNKEDYLIVSFKNDRSKIGLLMMQTLNNDKVPSSNEKYQVDDEIDAFFLEEKPSGFYLTIPFIDSDQLLQKSKKTENSLLEGSQVNAIIKSKKSDCVFLQIYSQSQLVIGRLHRIECQSNTEFEAFAIGDQVQAKILRISKDDKKTWIELTRRKEHMKKPFDLDELTLKQTYHSLEDLKNDKEYEAVITEVNYAYSHPLQISLSPFVRGQVSFNRVLDVETLQREGSSYLKKFKPGQKVNVTYRDGAFSLIKANKKGKIQKGDIFVVRFVKAVNGKGITVQINENTFGFIEICEITDDIIGVICQHQMENSPIFLARVIGFEKGDKPLLSSRESVIDDEKWKLVSPEGKSIHFQKLDEAYQKIGNQRNKIFKYGANIALNEGDLCLGYVINTSKSGCFIQIGHKTTVRAGLNELSDDSSFDFQEQMPPGRLVLTRVVKTEQKGENKWFHVSLRKSIVVYGANALNKDALSPETQVQCIVLAISDDKIFAQIKGSYQKLKIKGAPKGSLKPGNHATVQLLKVEKQKMTGTYKQKLKDSMNDQTQQQIEKLWRLIESEAEKDINKVVHKKQKQQQEQEMIKRLGNQENEIEEQIKDLNELQDNEDDDMEVVQGDDSDIEEMQRIIKESKTYEEKSDEDDESYEDEEMKDSSEEDGKEQGSDQSMEESEEEEKKKKKKLSGKNSLKQRIKEEHQIRLKENALKDGKEQPRDIDDFERLLVANQDQSYIWIQYMAFMLDKLGADSARKIAEKAVKSVSISNEEDKFNLWVAYMNLENNFGTQETLEKVIKRALEVNDRKKIYLQLINIYKTSHKYQYIEDIFKVLSKKYNTSLDVWTQYLEFLFEVKDLQKSQIIFLLQGLTFSDPKLILQKALQSLPKENHVNIISKIGQLEFKYGQPESGRTMFEGIVNNYPKRMDIWSIYMDMESKYCGDNKQQARHLFERCLNNAFIQKKPKKMKLVFQKYMEFELSSQNKKNVDKLRKRVEEYLENAFKKNDTSQEDSE